MVMNPLADVEKRVSQLEYRNKVLGLILVEQKRVNEMAGRTLHAINKALEERTDGLLKALERIGRRLKTLEKEIGDE